MLPSPVQVLPVQGDVRDVQSVRAAADACVRELGLPQIIINNAAGNFVSPTERLSPNAFKTVVDIVLLGSAYVTLEFGKRLIEAEQGCSFLSITTTYTQCGSAYVVPSASAKAGLEIMTRLGTDDSVLACVTHLSFNGSWSNTVKPHSILSPFGSYRPNIIKTGN